MRNQLLFWTFLLTSITSLSQETQTGKPRSIWTTEWSGDGKYIAVGGDDSTIWIYHSKDYLLYKKFRANSMVKGLSWHPTENLLAIATMQGVQLLDMEEELIKTIEEVRTGGRAISWNFNGALLAFADGRGKVQLLTRSGKLIRTISKHDNKSFLSVHWHPSENIILTGGDEIILFDTSGKLLNMFRIREAYTGILSVRWHPSGQFFATGDYGHENEGKPTLLQYWKADGTKLKEIPGHHEEIRNLRWSHDGNYLATAADGLRIWSSKGELIKSAKTGEALWGVCWSEDDQFIVTGSFAGGVVSLWTKEANLVKRLD